MIRTNRSVEDRGDALLRVENLVDVLNGRADGSSVICKETREEV